MRSTTFALASALALALVACQTTSHVGDEDSPYYVVPVGSRVILNRQLTIPPDRAGVFLQDGQVVAPGYTGQLRSYYPHCKFEVRRPMPTAQTINPDEFVVTRVSRQWASAVDSGMLQYAAVNRDMLRPVAAKDGRRRVADSDQDSGPNIRAFVTTMELGSDRQPHVARLVCAQWGYPHEDRHVTIKEIRRALGDLATLRLAETQK